ncbi:methyl-accepting chemotaxis protein [Halioglobus sp. HI00S01]|uniref:methyl-accepting chemotaxis protein n=1 Tax=Halioglobus sp. HI00S01 TaxID=1822214 RepID=UPI0009ED69E1|nr:methyl-accepting chemotaxis protein [Halioglobus sp. HI00S01]
MSRSSTKKVGDDPLEWLQKSAKQGGGRKPVGRGDSRKKPAAKRLSTSVIPQPSVPDPAALVEASFKQVASRGEEIVSLFYERLFDRYPQVELFFEGVDQQEQKKKLLAALSTMVASLRNPDKLAPILAEMGSRHQEYGAEVEHYGAVAETLVEVLADVSGEEWNKDISHAWKSTLWSVAQMMLVGYESEKDADMASSSVAALAVPEEYEHTAEELSRMRSAVDGAMTAIMMVDRDFVVTYANQATLDLLSKHRDTLASVYPGFSPDALIGTCIDSFHKRPEHQRALLADPANLPWRTDISIGPLKFALNVTAIVDERGDYLGNTLEWSDVTALREKELQTARLNSSIDGAMTAIMMIDRDFTVTYANEATLQLLRDNQATLSSIYPGFNPDKLIGSCIDGFHKNPEHQRNILADPANLPWRTDIEVADLKFSLNVTAIVDAQGNYLGNTLEWSDVTTLRQQELQTARLNSSIDGAMTAIMMIDRDFIVTYANDATLQLLRKNQETLSSIYPGFNPDKLIGACIDGFHKKPEHQRNILSDPSNLPWRTDIEVGHLKFSLNVTAIVDGDGNYLGNTLEWADVTELRKKEMENARLQSAIAGATTRLMLCDENLDIIYCNPAAMDMFQNRSSEMREVFPGFDASKLIGESIDQFHKNPAHQRRLLQDKNMLPASAKIHVLDLVFQVNATMIEGANGEYLGNIVEWVDMTEQHNAETELSALVSAASEGDFSISMDVERYQGFYRDLGTTINGIMVGLKDLSEVLASLSQGDLTCGMNGQYDGLFAKFKEDVNGTVDVLRDMVNQILTSSTNISSSSSEISEGNSDLLQRTESQASSLEETASSMEEMTAAVKSSADNARQANQLAASAREQAETGGQVVSRAVDAMSEINKSSNQIAEIISVIDEIAFQTNLLALNAAVEAARAGEQGRGFAVVAAEVRNLAQRSAEAAKEIKALIKDSVAKVDDGSRLVGESGNTLTEIVTAVKKVSDIIAEIAAAAQEQSLGIDQVNTAVSQLDEVTQKNAAMVEEAAAASESMAEQSNGLIQLMEFFNIGENDSSPAAPARGGRAQSQGRPPRAAAPRRKVSKSESDEWEEF